MLINTLGLLDCWMGTVPTNESFKSSLFLAFTRLLTSFQTIFKINMMQFYLLNMVRGADVVHCSRPPGGSCETCQTPLLGHTGYSMLAVTKWRLVPGVWRDSGDVAAVCSADLQLLAMSLWAVLPLSLPVFIISGIWIVYAMALYNQHVCPVDNWLYNTSCEEQLPLQRGPVLCCTLDNIPLISKCGTLPPESCFFSLICSAGSFLMMLIGLLRYAQVIDKHQNCVLNTAGLSTTWICAAGLILLGNFQVDFAKVLHYVGAGVAFPSSMLAVCLQSALTYKLAKTQEQYWVGHLRMGMTLLALNALVLSGVFFCQESFVLQHASAIFEWIYCILIMLFYGTFAFEFGDMTRETLMVLSRRGSDRSFSSDHKVEAVGGSNHHQAEGFPMVEASW